MSEIASIAGSKLLASLIGYGVGTARTELIVQCGSGAKIGKLWRWQLNLFHEGTSDILNAVDGAERYKVKKIIPVTGRANRTFQAKTCYAAIVKEMSLFFETQVAFGTVSVIIEPENQQTSTFLGSSLPPVAGKMEEIAVGDTL